jgi:hypothetical protein
MSISGSLSPQAARNRIAFSTDMIFSHSPGITCVRPVHALSGRRAFPGERESMEPAHNTSMCPPTTFSWSHPHEGNGGQSSLHSVSGPPMHQAQSECQDDAEIQHPGANQPGSPLPNMAAIWVRARRGNQPGGQEAYRRNLHVRCGTGLLSDIRCQARRRGSLTATNAIENLSRPPHSQGYYYGSMPKMREFKFIFDLFVSSKKSRGSIFAWGRGVAGREGLTGASAAVCG